MTTVNKLIIKDLKIYAYHGDLPEEKVLGQFFLLDFVFYLNDFEYEMEEKIENTVNYVELIRCVKKEFTGRKFNLIETAANYLCDCILEEFPKISKIELTLKKTSPPVDAFFSYVGVEVTKSRD